MAPPPHFIHPSRSLEETSAFWYPIIRDLGWNRSLSDGPTHYHAALDGQTWLLMTPQGSSTPDNAGAGQDSERIGKPGLPSAVPTSLSPQGCVLALPFSNGTGWIGFFLVSSAHCGQGLGGALWRGMDAVWAQNGTRVIGLDGVEEQVPTYTRRGFVDVGRIVLMSCSASEAMNAKIGEAVDGGAVSDIRHAEREELRRLDEMYTGLDRGRYWISSGLLDREDVFGFAHYIDTKLDGFVLVRGCEEGHRVGPLFAPSAAVATQLLQLAMQHPSVAKSGGSLIVEVFGANAGAKRVFEGLGWSDVGVEYHRMWYEGRVPEPQQDGGLGTKGMFAVFDAACG
ncbi:hypothetical protein E8E12_009272 [Didymella heteroderae]|uniref:YitH/HolE acetyltransferase (GNAT) domain-containing protein n=1 Tax=Didymella heteroderae TaxID=1769908 RepID=A0A9P4WX69_9PLEO|nr:hypothetical protein E8E12_009272 [Didymella heteroderae]